MKRLFFSLLCLAICVGSGCASSDNKTYEEMYTDGDLQSTPNFTQLRDIPVPERATLDLKRTLLFGSDPLVGRLGFAAPYAQSSLVDFFIQEMPKYGWTEVAVVRSSQSVMTFAKDIRVAMIRLNPETDTQSEIMFDISLNRKMKSFQQ